jgi:glycosyltransferase involved in cell wall biosynthesis
LLLPDRYASFESSSFLSIRVFCVIRGFNLLLNFSTRMLVSVVIPTFNCADFLVEAVRSVLDQTYQDFEILVVDDASTDNTKSVLLAFGPRVRYIRQERAGPSVARNLAILQSQGELIAFLDADDLWRPTKLDRQLEYLNHHPETILVYTDFTRGPSPGSNNESRLQAFKPRDPTDPFHALLDENFVATPTVVVRREALARSGLFDPTLKGSEDLDLWLRLAHAHGWRSVGFIDEILVDVRQHPGNTSRTVDFMKEQVRATHLMLARWADDPEAVRLLSRRLGNCLWNLAFAEQSLGHFAEARTAYWSSGRIAFAARPSALTSFRKWRDRELLPPVAGAFTRAAFLSLPTPVILMAQKWTNRGGSPSRPGR